MSLSKQLFRESALERLSSPEQLDQLLQVTSPKGWFSLVAIWAILVTVILWSIFGVAPTIEEGRGILVAGGGLGQVVAPGAGRLQSIHVSVGDLIVKDQVVADIDKQDIRDQIADAESELRELRAQHERLTEFDANEERLQERLAKEETDRLNQSIEYSTARIERLRERRNLVAVEVEKGSMIKIDLERIEEEIEVEQLKIVQSRLTIQQLVGKNQTATSQRQRDALTRQLKADDLARAAEMLKNRLAREAVVRSPFAGRVVEVRAAVHNTVAIGDPILLIETVSAGAPADVGATQSLRAVLYVSAHTGKRINAGMEVELVPSTVKREEYGSMVGKVVRVAPTPTSKSAMMTSLSDRDLVERFTQEIGLPLQVDVELIPVGDQTPSGYKWTSAVGPPIKISAGTLCSGSVTVKRQNPISLVIPGIRRAFGAD